MESVYFNVTFHFRLQFRNIYYGSILDSCVCDPEWKGS